MPSVTAPTQPEMPLIRRANKTPFTTEIIAPRSEEHRQITFARPAAVDIAIAAAHGAERRAEVGARRVRHRFAKREPAGGIADQRGKDIGFLERQANGHAQGFLPAAEEDAAVDFPGPIKRGELVIQQPRAQHATVGRQIF